MLKRKFHRATISILILVILLSLNGGEILYSLPDTYSNQEMAKRIQCYYEAQSRSVNCKTIEATLNAIDLYLKYYFPNGPFCKQDFVAIAMLESDFNQYELGKSGERGIFQIMDCSIPKTVKNPFNINTNTALAMQVMQHKFNRHKDYKKAVIAYNGVVRLPNNKWSEKYWKYFRKYKNILSDLGIS